jgi:hypothetical protein
LINQKGVTIGGLLKALSKPGRSHPWRSAESVDKQERSHPWRSAESVV